MVTAFDTSSSKGRCAENCSLRTKSARGRHRHSQFLAGGPATSSVGTLQGKVGDGSRYNACSIADAEQDAPALTPHHAFHAWTIASEKSTIRSATLFIEQRPGVAIHRDAHCWNRASRAASLRPALGVIVPRRATPRLSTVLKFGFGRSGRRLKPSAGPSAGGQRLAPAAN
jgi:hypothetical protein